MTVVSIWAMLPRKSPGCCGSALYPLPCPPAGNPVSGGAWAADCQAPVGACPSGWTPPAWVPYPSAAPVAEPRPFGPGPRPFGPGGGRSSGLFLLTTKGNSDSCRGLFLRFLPTVRPAGPCQSCTEGSACSLAPSSRCGTAWSSSPRSTPRRSCCRARESRGPHSLAPRRLSVGKLSYSGLCRRR